MLNSLLNLILKYIFTLTLNQESTVLAPVGEKAWQNPWNSLPNLLLGPGPLFGGWRRVRVTDYRLKLSSREGSITEMLE